MAERHFLRTANVLKVLELIAISDIFYELPDSLHISFKIIHIAGLQSDRDGQLLMPDKFRTEPRPQNTVLILK
jgi:hypothetical protein